MAAQEQAFLRVLRQQLIDARMRRHLTSQDAATLAGISRAGLDKIEAGTNTPSLETLIKLAGVYECTLSQLFAEAQKKSKWAARRLPGVSSARVLDTEYDHALKQLTLQAGQKKHYELLSAFQRLEEKDSTKAELIRNLLCSIAPKTRSKKK